MRRRHAATIDIDGLDRLSPAKLRDLWAQELGEQPPASLGRDILALGIAYAMQERLQGGLTRPVAKELNWLLDRMLREGVADMPRHRHLGCRGVEPFWCANGRGLPIT